MRFLQSSAASFLFSLLLILLPQSCRGEPLVPRQSGPAAILQGTSNEGRFESRGEFDPGHGGAYGLAANSDATRLYVVGESCWLDILDISDPSAVRSIAQQQFDGMPYGSESECGIAYDPHYERLAVGGGPGKKVYLIDVSDDQLSLLDASYPPDLQFPGLEFPSLITTPPVFIKQGSAIALAMKTGGSVEDADSGEMRYFGEGVTLVAIDPLTGKLSVTDEGIGGFSTVYGQVYDPTRDLLWCGGQEGAEAILDFSNGPINQFRYWSYSPGEEEPRIMPDLITRDGRWLIERTASRFPASDWSVRIRQVEAVDGTYSLWNADMPTDGAAPHMRGSATSPPVGPLLPCVFTHAESCVITAEVDGNELLILDVSDKTAAPQLLFTVSLAEGEHIQCIRGHRNRFYVSLKSGRILIYEWDYVQAPAPPTDLVAVPSSSDQSISLSWSAPSTGVAPAGYCIYRRTATTAFEKVGVANETTWKDDRTSEATTYTYMVRSFAPEYGPIESEDSMEAQADSPSGVAPKQVTGLSGHPTLGGVSLRWDPNDEADITGYLVYRKTGDASFLKITPSALTEACCLDLDVEPGVEYSYRVTAVDADLEGPPSDAVSVSPADRTPNLLQNPGAEEQSVTSWAHASTIPAPDPANRYPFDNDLFIGVTSGWSAEGQWAFWGDRTSGRYDRQTYNPVDETYLLAAYQDVDVSPFSAAIGSPERTIVADWGGQLIRTTTEQSALPSIAVEFLDAAQGVLGRHELSSQTTGEWVALSSRQPLPASTTSVRFWMFAPEVTASPVNAAWDDLRLVLREEQSAEPLCLTVERTASGMSLTFAPTTPGVNYQIEYADILPPGETGWKACGPAFVGDGGTVEWLDSSSEPTNPTDPPASTARFRFYRVRQQ